MISIINYGLGNVKAFSNIFNRLHVDHQLIDRHSDFSTVTKLVLPGVGSFDHAMSALEDSGLRDKLDELVLGESVPILGVCVGMQMMADSSEEGVKPGLGWIPGRVKRFDISNIGIPSLPLPHMGWNSLQVEKENTIFNDLDEKKRFYFLHSYFFECDNSDHVLATASYGSKYSCVIQKNNITGIQCHPEKSHHNGVAFLKNFASL